MAERAWLPSSRHRAEFRLSPYDVLCAALAPWIAFWLRGADPFAPGLLFDSLIYAGVSFTLTLVAFTIFRVGRGLTRYFSSHEAFDLAKAVVLAMALTALVMFTFTRLDVAPRSLFAIHAATLGALLIVGRAVSARRETRRALRRGPEASAATTHVIVLGANDLAAHYVRLLDRFTGGRQKVIALLDPNPRFRGRSIAGAHVIGDPPALASVLDEYAVHGVEVHKIVVASPGLARDADLMATIRSVCVERGLVFEDVAERLGLAATAQDLDEGAPADASPEGPAAGYFLAKRLVDLAIAVPLAIVLAPVALIVAAVVRYDVGSPVLFWQQRVGRGRRPIRVIKFRTLHAPYDREGRLIPVQDRLSGIGAFLRRTRLDEIPQLYNILVGDMAIVGPRPLLPIDLAGDADVRFAVAPGLTGWAQVHGGKLITPDEKNALDEWYVRHASFLLDLRIMVLTAWTMVTGDVRNDLAVESALAERRARRRVTMAGAGGDAPARPADREA